MSEFTYGYLSVAAVAIFSLRNYISILEKPLAGVVGFEPTNTRVKVLCLYQLGDTPIIIPL